MNDPLAQFRKKPINVGQAPPTGQGPDDYVAFGAKDRVERLKIRRAMAPTRAPGYHYLLDISYDGPFGTNFVLVFTFMMVMVRGRNLQGVVGALELGTCDFIQEFDGERWSMPKDPALPLIDSIEVAVMEKDEAMEEAEKFKRPPRPH